MGTTTILVSDFKERTRRFSYWVMAALALFAAVMCVPRAVGKTTRVMILQPEVFIQAGNPTWVPLCAAMVTGMLLPIFMYVYLKNAVGTDRSTGVMDLLLSSRLRRVPYVLGKFLSGVLIALSLLAIVMAGSFLMVLMHYPGQGISPWVFVSLFLALVPGLIFSAAMALFSETVPFLRTRGGSIVMIIFFFMLMVMSINSSIHAAGHSTLHTATSIFDISGMGALTEAIYAAALAATGKPYDGGLTLIGSYGKGGIPDTGTVQLVIGGVNFSAGRLLDMAIFLLVSLAVVLLAAVLLERRPLKAREKKGLKLGKTATYKQPVAATPWQPVPAKRPRLAAMAGAELMRISKGLSLYWLVPMLGLWIGSWFAPPETNQSVLFPLIYGWAMLPLSELGAEEKQSGVFGWMRAVNGAPLRQAIASYIAGVAFCLVLSAPPIARLMDAGAILVAFAWVFAVPAAALALGSYSKTPRVFQILFICVLYVFMNMTDLFMPFGLAQAIPCAISALFVAAVALVAVCAERIRAQR